LFDKKIRRLRPNWFENTANTKKEMLFVLARQGKTRRAAMKATNGALGEFTERRRVYDPVFDTKIRRLRSDWFVDPVDTKKQQIRKLAEDPAQKRPRDLSKRLAERQLATALRRYARDPAFAREMRSKRPDWFRSTADKMRLQAKRNTLLALAKQGAPRPLQSKANSRELVALSRTLSQLTNPSDETYDEEFTKTVKQLAPHWFDAKIVGKQKAARRHDREAVRAA